MEKILIIEDDQQIQEVISICLEHEALPYMIASTGEEGLNKAKESQPSLILLDIMLPDMNGYTVCKELKKYCNAPIIFMSCLNGENDQILGYSLGAEDYIEKPFNINILLAKIKAQLRRNRILAKESTSRKTTHICIDTLEIDVNAREITVNGQKIHLTVKEYDLLLFLIKNSNHVFSTYDLLEKVWGLDSPSEDKTIVVHISSLRKKIEEDPLNPKYITTVRGAGYKFVYHKQD